MALVVRRLQHFTMMAYDWSPLKQATTITKYVCARSRNVTSLFISDMPFHRILGDKSTRVAGKEAQSSGNGVVLAVKVVNHPGVSSMRTWLFVSLARSPGALDYRCDASLIWRLCSCVQ